MGCGSQILPWESESAKCTRPTEWEEDEGRQKAYGHINSLQKLAFNLQGARQKGIALQRSYHVVSRLVSWSDNSRRSHPGSLQAFDERFPTFSAATDEGVAGSLHTSLCTGSCKMFPQHAAILSVIKWLFDNGLQTRAISKTIQYGVSLS